MTFTYPIDKITETEVVDGKTVPTEKALIAQVRMLINDVVEAKALVQDEELKFLIAQWYPVHGTPYYVASVVADNIANRYAGEVSYSADGVSIGLGARAQQYRDLAASLREQHKALLIGGGPDVGGISPGEETDHSIAAFDFGTGMHDNIEAGRQNYGGRGHLRPVELTGGFDSE